MLKNSNLLNPDIFKLISGLGHTQFIVIADSGLPLPKDSKVIDISFTSGNPSFSEVLEVLSGLLIIEKYVYAKEIESVNEPVFSHILETLNGIPSESTTHEKLKELTLGAEAIIRTGECSQFSNILLYGGVNF